MRLTIIRTDGTEEEHDVPKERAFQEIDRLIGATCTDCVNLRAGRVMIVDDNGYETETIDHGDGRFELRCIKARKPVNEKATAMYHAICRPGTTHQIVGDVAIALDEDFA